MNKIVEITYKLQYDSKTRDIVEIIDRLFLERCNVYLNTDNHEITDDDICSNCGSFADEITMYEIIVKYKDKTMFSFYICIICAEKNNLMGVLENE